MDLKSTEAELTSIAANAAKGSFRYGYQWLAVHPRFATVTFAAVLIGTNALTFASAKGWL